MRGIDRGTADPGGWDGPGDIWAAHILFADLGKSNDEVYNHPFTTLIWVFSEQRNASAEYKHDGFRHLHERREREQSQYWHRDGQRFWVFGQQSDASGIELQCCGSHVHRGVLVQC